jgi:biopolymer transport protein ExbB
MSKKSSMSESLRSVFAAIVMPLALVVAYLIYTYILGDPANFVGGDPANEPLKDNYLGTIHKGGPIVVLLIGFQIILVSYVIERFFSIGKASGKGGNSVFVYKIKEMVASGQHQEALTACDKQRGSVANVVRNGVETLMRLKASSDGDDDKKALTLQQELEEATQLELPQLNRNMIVISTLASISTLIGLLGTVTGMIKAFASLARVGAPDAVGLASGISQALVTTALGISTAAVAIVFYNYFTNRIDKLTFSIDESSFSIVNTFKTKG